MLLLLPVLLLLLLLLELLLLLRLPPQPVMHTFRLLLQCCTQALQQLHLYLCGCCC
jgi:hypothetical protein